MIYGVEIYVRVCGCSQLVETGEGLAAIKERPVIGVRTETVIPSSLNVEGDEVEAEISRTRSPKICFNYKATCVDSLQEVDF